MKQSVLFLEQQNWRGGAQCVLEEVLRAIGQDFLPLVSFPEDGPFAAELRLSGIETLILPLGRYRSGRKSLVEIAAFPPRSLYCGIQLARTIRRRHIQLVYINGPRCLVAGVFAARVTGTPSLFHLHLTMTRRTDTLVATLAARHATRIVACCEAAAAALLKRSPRLARTLQVIYNPVRQLVSNAASSQRDIRSTTLVNSARPVVGVVGRICPQKGQHILLRAAARLRRRGRDIQVIFLGAPHENSAEDAAYVRFLESSERQLGLEGRIEWPGYQADPNPYFSAFDVLVIPSTASASEGLPLVALEAMRWGVPVIASHIGGIPEVVRDGENGFLVPPGDEMALAEALKCVLGNASLRARLGTGARATIDQRFSTETFRKSIRTIVSELCSPARTPRTQVQTEEVKARI